MARDAIVRRGATQTGDVPVLELLERQMRGQAPRLAPDPLLHRTLGAPAPPGLALDPTREQPGVGFRPPTVPGPVIPRVPGVGGGGGIGRRLAKAIVDGHVPTWRGAELMRNTTRSVPPPIIIPAFPSVTNFTSWGSTFPPPMVLAPVCCVEEFQFPFSIRMNATFKSVSTPFSAQGIYSSVPPCACDCCCFMQLFEDVDSFTQQVTDPLQEDCLEDSCTAGTWSDADVAYRTSTQCFWTFADEPVWGFNPRKPGWPETEFIGVIFDVCNDWVIQAWDAFKVRTDVTLRSAAEQRAYYADTGPDGDRMLRGLHNPRSGKK